MTSENPFDAQPHGLGEPIFFEATDGV